MTGQTYADKALDKANKLLGFLEGYDSMSEAKAAFVCHAIEEIFKRLERRKEDRRK